MQNTIHPNIMPSTGIKLAWIPDSQLWLGSSKSPIALGLFFSKRYTYRICLKGTYKKPSLRRRTYPNRRPLPGGAAAEKTARRGEMGILVQDIVSGGNAP